VIDNSSSLRARRDVSVPQKVKDEFSMDCTPVMTQLNDQQFLTVCDTSKNGLGAGVYVQLFNAAGIGETPQRVNVPFRIDSDSTGRFTRSYMAKLNDRQFMLSWQSWNLYAANDSKIYLQVVTLEPV